MSTDYQLDWNLLYEKQQALLREAKEYIVANHEQVANWYALRLDTILEPIQSMTFSIDEYDNLTAQVKTSSSIHFYDYMGYQSIIDIAHYIHQRITAKQTDL